MKFVSYTLKYYYLSLKHATIVFCKLFMSYILVFCLIYKGFITNIKMNEYSLHCIGHIVYTQVTRIFIVR